jgi:excisionase family DNA binding protein
MSFNNQAGRPTTSPIEEWLTVDELADLLGVSRQSVYRWRHSDGMPSHKIGRLVRFDVREVEEWIRSRCSSPAPANTARGAA